MTAVLSRPRTISAKVATAALAVIALLASLLGPTWLALFGKSNVDFADLRTATRPAAAPGLQHAYFGWLAWTLTIVVIAAVAAGVATGGSLRRASAVLAILLSLAGIVITLGCVKQLDVEDPGGSFWTHFGWIRWGGYLHVIGWVLAIITAGATLRATDHAR
ncbi:MAG TPA: hypothetical protein VE442_22565 [Jatrophihabitans sp.]|nr:hypothetical protein [Jatrophihabitans sp.]